MGIIESALILGFLCMVVGCMTVTAEVQQFTLYRKLILGFIAAIPVALVICLTVLSIYFDVNPFLNIQVSVIG